MRINNIQLERFGNRDHLFLDGLSDTLNVVFGPNGSGKSASIGFLRWMLFGGSENARRGLNPSAPVSASGRLTISNRGRQQTIARQDDGTRYGRVHLDGVEHLGVETNHLVPLLADITLHDFDRIFAPNFGQEPNLTGLLQSAQSRGVNLATTRLPSDRNQELRLRIDQLRRDMERLPWQGQALTHLIDRRDTLKRRIAALEEDHHKRRGSVQAEYDDLNRQIKLRESDIERLRGDWHAKDSEVAARRRALEEAWRRAEEAKQEYIRKLRNDLADVETHLSRARNMVNEMRQRYERVDANLREYDVQRPYGTPADTHCQVESIARQLDELRSLSLGRPHVPDTYRQNTTAPLSHSQADLDRVRSELSRLCDVLQQQREGIHAEKLSGEITQLQQCEESTTRWVAELERQRNQLADELDQAERFGVSLVLDHSGPRADATYEDHGLIDPSRIRAVLHTCDGYQPIAPDSDRLLQQLIRERDVLSGDMETAERYLRRLLDRRRQLESALERFTDFEANTARRELAEVEAQMRVAEDRERLQDEIHRLEAEQSTINEHWVHAPVTQRAAEILRRLSVGQWVGIRVEGTAAVMVEDPRGQWASSDQLSRGSRDQLYLAFCLSIIAELRDRGVELPLILNDAFINVDSRSDQVLADVITDFARQGFQVVLFTRHQHVARIFEGLHARIFELGARLTPIVTPVVEQPIEQVRFRQMDHEQQRERPLVRRVRTTRSMPRRDAYDRHEMEDVTFSNEMGTVRQREPVRYRDDIDDLIDENEIITLATPLEALDLLDGREAAAFRALRVVTVGDFLDANASTLSAGLERAGLAERPVIRWQDELALCVHVAGLTMADARVLAATGIASVRDLSTIDAENLCQRVERYLSSSQRHSSRSGYSSPLYRLSRNQATEWIRLARSAYSGSHRSSNGNGTRGLRSRAVRAESEDLDWSRQNRSYDDGYDHDRDPQPSRRRTTRSSRTGRSSSARRRSSSREWESQPRTSRRRSSSRSERTNSRRPTVETREASRATVSESETTSSGLKFYLAASDPVVDAPSIGPRTAERLAPAGIVTVADLLKVDAARLADEVGYSRITAELIREWQAQALLACCIPSLRGHDAQILVACGLNNPEEIAQMNAEDLWERVRPFIKTAEGKRIIRGGKLPDLSEVRDWVMFAQSARSPERRVTDVRRKDDRKATESSRIVHHAARRATYDGGRSARVVARSSLGSTPH